MPRIGRHGIMSLAVCIYGILTCEASIKACGDYGLKAITYLSSVRQPRLTLNINLKTLNLFLSLQSQEIDVGQRN